MVAQIIHNDLCTEHSFGNDRNKNEENNQWNEIKQKWIYFVNIFSFCFTIEMFVNMLFLIFAECLKWYIC